MQSNSFASMIKRVIFLLKYAIFWLLIFALARLLFEIYNFPKTTQLPLNEILLSYIHGIRLDGSITGYFTIIIALLVSVTAFINPKYLKYPINYLTYFLIFTALMVTVIDLELYRNWGFRMDATPLSYLATPAEALASTPVWLFGILVAFWITLSLTVSWIYKRQLSPLIDTFPPLKWYYSPLLILFTALFFIPVRGTFTVAPINAGTVYFSNNQFANHAAVNVTWNFGDALTRIKKRKQEVQLISNEVATKVVSELYSTQDSTIHLLNTTRPNIILIVLESFSSDAVSFFGGEKEITPHLNRLATEGIAFTNIYASASRSDKGLVSTLSGYPSQLGVSIMNFPNKTRNLPSIAKSLKTLNYNSIFYYGGDADFGNIRSYMLNVGFNKVDDIFTLPSEFDRSSKWGIHDHEMVEYLTKEADKEQGSFFKVLFTLSSHEPFDVPAETVIKGDDLKSKCLNSMHYTDAAIGKFIETAKTKAWWKNSLIILIADHSGRFPYDREMHLPERYAIPMIWLGGALNTSGVVINKIGGQQDIAATLLSQMEIPHTHFPYSNNLLSTNALPFASYTWANGIGYVSDKGQIAFDVKTKACIWQKGDTTNLGLHAKSLLQIYSNDFNNKEIEKK